MAFWPVATLVLLIYIASFYIIQNNDMHWERVGVIELGQTYNQLISVDSLFIIRLVFAAIIWATLFIAVSDDKGLSVTFEGIDGVKKVFTMKYLERLTAFTVWSWILQGLYFSIAAYASYLAININDMNQSKTIPLFPTIAWVFYEISLPVSYLVSLVVAFVLIPGMKKAKLPTDIFFTPISLLMHNANLVFMIFEFMVNGLPILYWHFAFIFIYACTYVVFAWIWYQYKKMFYYFFLDYNRAGSLYWQIGLIFILYVLYAMCCACSYARLHYDGIFPALVSDLFISNRY
jgi:hypothetical protein